VCVRACVWMRARVRVYGCARVCVCVDARACACVWMRGRRVCVDARACACVYVYITMYECRICNVKAKFYKNK